MDAPSTLFEFVYRTLCAVDNDPARSAWLPRRLAALAGPGGVGKRLPLRVAAFDLGAITGDAGTTFQNAIAGSWWLLQGTKHRKDPELARHRGVACPNDPWPRLDVSDVIVGGLENAFLLPLRDVSQRAAGDRAIVSCALGHYRGQGGLPSLPPLTMTGTYRIRQRVCSAPVDGVAIVCDGYAAEEEVVGAGRFAVTLDGVLADLTLRVEVAGSDGARRLAVVVEAIALRGDGIDALPGLTIDALTVETSWAWMSDNIWLPQARAALESVDGRAGLLASLAATLEEPATLAQADASITAQLDGLLDATLSAVPPGALPSDGTPAGDDPCDRYVFDRVRVALGDPASDCYLPRAVADAEQPSLEPLTIDRIELPDTSFQGIALRRLELTTVAVVGLSNLSPERMLLDGAVVDATLRFSVLAPPPRVLVTRAGQPLARDLPAGPLVITGRFSMRADDIDAPIVGSFVCTVARAVAHARARLGGAQLDALTVAFESMRLDADLAATALTVVVDSQLGDLIQQVLDGDPQKRALFDAVDHALTGHLDRLGAAATARLRQLAAARIDR